jgi:hypothetical protein
MVATFKMIEIRLQRRLNGRFAVCFLLLCVATMFHAGVTEGHAAPSGSAEFTPNKEQLRSTAKGDEHPTPLPTEKPKKLKMNFLRFRPQMVLMCNYLNEDGRRDHFSEMILPFAEKDDSCPACKPFFGTLVSACKPPKEKKERRSSKEPEPSVTPTAKPNIKEREPNLQLINVTVNLFLELAEIEREQAELLQALRKFLVLLRDPDGKSKAETEYFQSLAEVVEAPFADHLRKAAKEEAAATRNEDRNKAVLEDLF